MKKKMMILLTAFFVVLGLTSPGTAYRGGGYCNTDWPGIRPGLNLTQDQRKRFNDLQTENLEEISTVSQTITQKQLETDRLFLDVSPDSSRLTKLQKEISNLQARQNEIKLSYQLKARKILTAEQLTLVPPGCSFGFNSMQYDRPAGYGYDYDRGHGRGYGQGHGRGYGQGYGRGYGRGHGRGHGYGCRW